VGGIITPYRAARKTIYWPVLGGNKGGSEPHRVGVKGEGGNWEKGNNGPE